MNWKMVNLFALTVVVSLLLPFSCNAADTKARFMIVITDSADQPLEGVTVTLTSQVSDGKKYTLITKENGKAMKIDLDPAMYELRCEKKGYKVLEGPIKLRPGVNAKRSMWMLTLGETKGQSFREHPRPERRNAYFALIAYNAGHDAYQVDDLETALVEFKKAIELQPEEKSYYFAYLVLGHKAFKQQDFESAIRYLTTALEYDVQKIAHKDTCTFLSAAHYLIGDTETAIKVSKEQSESFPLAALLHNMATIEIYRKNMEGAIELLVQSYKEFPEYLDSIRLLANTYAEERYYSEAIQLYHVLLRKFLEHNCIDPLEIREVFESIDRLEKKRANSEYAKSVYGIFF